MALSTSPTRRTASSAVIAPDGTVSTVAGTGRAGFADGAALSARFASPEGIAIRADGAVVVADTGNHAIRLVAAGSVTTIAGNGTAGSADGPTATASFQRPRGLALDESGTLFISDSGNGLIRSLSGQSVGTVAGPAERRNITQLIDGAVGAATFDEPSAIAFAGALYIADSAHDAIRVVHPVLRLDAIVPERGPSAGGNTIRILGSGFMPGTTAEIGSSSVTGLIYASSTELTGDAPAGTGTVDVTVTSDGSSAILPDAYTYVSPPTLTSIAPAKGPTAGGQVVTIEGSNFIEGATEVFFGSSAATAVIFEGMGRLAATTPPGTEGVTSVVVRTAEGEATIADAYFYVAPPAIMSFAPLQGRRERSTSCARR